MEPPRELVRILSNLSERVFKLHGWWKSDTAKDMYILQDVSKRLQVTSQLGL